MMDANNNIAGDASDETDSRPSANSRDDNDSERDNESSDSGVSEGSGRHYVPMEGAYDPHSDGSDGSDESERDNTPHTCHLPQPAEPRSHSYLPGASHPLYPEEWIGNSEAHPSSQTNDGPIELPILELDNVILFPGCTVPLRLRNPQVVEYLGTRIDEARLGVGGSRKQVEIGILMRLDVTRRRTGTGRRIGEDDEDGSTRPRGTGRTGGAGRIGRWRTELLRRGIRRNRRETEEDTAGDVSPVRGGDNAEGVSNHDEPQEGGDDPESLSRPRSRRRHRRSPSPQRPAVNDPLVGRVGTIATITFTHEEAVTDAAVNDDDDDPAAPYRSRVWQRHSGQLVMTALGTTRFRVIAKVDGSDESRVRPHEQLYRGHWSAIKIYNVERIEDDNLALPPVNMRRGFAFSRRVVDEDEMPTFEPCFHDNLAYRLGQVTPIPAETYLLVSPWILVQKIRAELADTPTWQGLYSGLPSCSANLADPLAFSYWVASNLPLPEFERLDLLEMPCLVERLRHIHGKIVQQRDLDKPIRCRQCLQGISTISNMFTVGGADGTTGAYVNEHGIVHQTITVRVCSSQNVHFVGRPESKDSWFPPYTWTIMECGTCYQHLGWRFDSKGQTAEKNNTDRPRTFYGLSGGSVTTEESQQRQPMPIRVRARLRRLEDTEPAAGVVLPLVAIWDGSGPPSETDTDDDGENVEESTHNS